MKTSTFLAILAVIYAIFGSAAVIAPGPVVAQWAGITLDASGEIVTRAGAAELLGLAGIFWLARSVDNATALRAVLAGNAVYVFLEAIVLLLAVTAGTAGAVAWGGFVVDAVLGAASVWFYTRVAN